MSEVSEQVAASVLFENDSIRVWDDRAAPGQTLHLHVHRQPYITVILAGERGETVDEGGGVQRRFEGLKRETFSTPGRMSFRSCMRCATQAPRSSRFSSSSY